MNNEVRRAQLRRIASGHVEWRLTRLDVDEQGRLNVRRWIEKKLAGVVDFVPDSLAA
jgi:hypothetical protein